MTHRCTSLDQIGESKLTVGFFRIILFYFYSRYNIYIYTHNLMYVLGTSTQKHLGRAMCDLQRSGVKNQVIAKLGKTCGSRTALYMYSNVLDELQKEANAVQSE